MKLPALTMLLCAAALATSTPTYASSAHTEQANLHRARSSSTLGGIMYWWGKVNQHFDANTGDWVTDPDGVSGADLDMLAYCQKWYPRTTEVIVDEDVTITTWRERGNVNAHTATMPSFRCVERER